LRSKTADGRAAFINNLFSMKSIFLSGRAQKAGRFNKGLKAGGTGNWRKKKKPHTSGKTKQEEPMVTGGGGGATVFHLPRVGVREKVVGSSIGRKKKGTISPRRLTGFTPGPEKFLRKRSRKKAIMRRPAGGG